MLMYEHNLHMSHAKMKNEGDYISCALSKGTAPSATPDREKTSHEIDKFQDIAATEYLCTLKRNEVAQSPLYMTYI